MVCREFLVPGPTLYFNPPAITALSLVAATTQEKGSLPQTLGHLCYLPAPTVDLLFSLDYYYPALFWALLPNSKEPPPPGIQSFHWPPH